MNTAYRAVVEIKKRKRRRSGFDLFKINWFKKNQGYKAIDKHTSSLISSEWKVLSSAERNEYAEKVKNLPSSNQTLIKKYYYLVILICIKNVTK